MPALHVCIHNVVRRPRRLNCKLLVSLLGSRHCFCCRGVASFLAGPVEVLVEARIMLLRTPPSRRLHAVQGDHAFGLRVLHSPTASAPSQSWRTICALAACHTAQPC